MNAVVSTLDARRAKARETFRVNGVPHRRVEEWKYTDLRGAFGETLEPASPNRSMILERDGIPDFFSRVAGPQIILSNGYLDLAASKNLAAWSDELDLFDLGDLSKGAPDWVEKWLGVVNRKRPSAMAEASLGSMLGGVALRVKPGKHIGAPIHLVHLVPDRELPNIVNTRVLVVVEDGGHLTLLESRASRQSTKTFLNIGAEFVLGDGAKLVHVRSAHRARDLVEVADLAVKLGGKSHYVAHFANFGAKLSRTELHISLDGEGAETHLSGVSVLNGHHADVTTHVTHAVGKTHSTQLFKYVAGGHSRGVYQGKVSVAVGANGSDSRQSAKGLLLGNHAEIDLKPELEILAGDVKCAHGAAIGDLDAESLFYLNSRGIPEAEARALLMRAFIGDAVDQIEDETLRASVWQAVDTALEGLS